MRNTGHRQPPLLPSILDRLLDDAPEETQVNRQKHFNLDDLKVSLARDLEALLNTRAIENSKQLHDFPLAAASVIHYGIPDLSDLSLMSPDDREALRKQVSRTIERYEPRLSQVRVSLDLLHDSRRLLRFKVSAILKVHPQRPPVSFDATLRLSSNSYQVSR